MPAPRLPRLGLLAVLLAAPWASRAAPMDLARPDARPEPPPPSAGALGRDVFLGGGDLGGVPPPPPTPLGPFKPFGERGREDGRTRVHFDDLANYRYAMPAAAPGDGKADDQGRIPSEVKAFGGNEVVIDGYMLPLDYERGKTRRFLLLRNTLACCYGTPPEPNEWILVDVAGDGFPPLQDLPITVSGRLEVAERWESGYLLGLYHLRADSLRLARRSAP